MLTLPALYALKVMDSRFIAPLPVGLLEGAAYASTCRARMPMLASAVQSRHNRRAAGNQPHDLAAIWSGLGALLQIQLPGEEFAGFFASESTPSC
jgi:hypothetical protein